jgi:peroxiredoxin
MKFEEIRCMDATLAQKLAAYSATLELRRPQIAKAYSDLIGRLEQAHADAQIPQVGDRLPDFVLSDEKGRIRRSDEFLSKGPLVLSFNRGHWCSFCKLELAALADAFEEITSKGATVASVIPERSQETSSLKQSLQLPFPMLSDIDCGYALSCGLMISLGQEVRNMLIELGVRIDLSQCGYGILVPIPATFVISSEGVILGGGGDVDFRKRVSVETVIAALDA